MFIRILDLIFFIFVTIKISKINFKLNITSYSTKNCLKRPQRHLPNKLHLLESLTLKLKKIQIKPVSLENCLWILKINIFRNTKRKIINVGQDLGL